MWHVSDVRQRANLIRGIRPYIYLILINMLLTIYLISTGLSLIGAVRSINDGSVQNIPGAFYWAMPFIPIANTLFALAAIKDLIKLK